MKAASPFRVQKFLGGLRYLVRLPERPYESPISLSREVGRQAENLPAH